MSLKSKKSFVGHRSAILFSRILGEGVFQQPLAITLIWSTNRGCLDRLFSAATLGLAPPRRPFRRLLAVQCGRVLLRVGYQLLQIAARNAPLSPCYVPDLEPLDLAVRKLLVEWRLEVEELIVLFLFLQGTRQMTRTHYEALPPIYGVSVLPAKTLPAHGPSPNIHNRNHDEQSLTRSLNG